MIGRVAASAGAGIAAAGGVAGLAGARSLSSAAARPVKRICVLGGSGSLGAEVVSKFSGAGWRTTSVDVRDTEGDTAIVLSGDEATPWRVNAAKLDASIADDTEANGKYDAVVCAAGGWAGGYPGDDEFMESLHLLFRLNIATAASAARIAQLHLADSGLVVLTGAAAAMSGTPFMAAYGMSKAATHHLVKSMALGGLPAGATALSVMPYTIDTPANRANMPDGDTSTWTPPSHFADRILGWAQGDDIPASGSLVAAITKGGATEFVVEE